MAMGRKIEGIKASVLTAFYTPKFLVDAVVRQIHATFSENGLTPMVSNAAVRVSVFSWSRESIIPEMRSFSMA